MKPPPVKQSELAVTADQFILYLGSKNVRASGFKRWNYIQRKDKCFSLASKKTTCANKQNSHCFCNKNTKEDLYSTHLSFTVGTLLNYHILI